MQRGSGPGAPDICLGDAQRGLPLANAVAQLQPGAESGDPGRLGLLHGDQQLVGQAVGVEVPASSEPLLPALAGSQLLHRLSGERAVGAPALGALLVAQGATALGRRTSPWFGVSRGAGPIPCPGGRPRGRRQPRTDERRRSARADRGDARRRRRPCRSNHGRVGRNLAQLDAALAELPDGVRAESEVLVDDPADALVSVSPDLDLLVMGSRGSGAHLAALLGSVSSRVAMKARCPVLVVPRGSTSWLAPRTQRAVTNAV